MTSRTQMIRSVHFCIDYHHRPLRHERDGYAAIGMDTWISIIGLAGNPGIDVDPLCLDELSCVSLHCSPFTYSPRIEENKDRPEKQEISEKARKLDV
jgi:hypothetical protein